MNAIATLSVLAVLLFAAGCPPPSPVPPSPDAQDGAPPAPPPVVDAQPVPTTCALACAAEARAGCPEGLSSKCVQVLQQNDQEHLTPVTCSCLSHATSAAAVRACGVACVIDGGAP